jgi:ribosomal protein L11 methylase PrmA
MILKDASAYNIQFIGAKPILIDTLSFTKYRAGQAWQAYRQFCQHFLAPLCLMSYVDPRMGKLLRDYIDGIPLDLAVKLLPGRAFVRYGILAHIFLHSKSQQKYSGEGAKGYVKSDLNISKTALLALIEGLYATVRKLSPPTVSTEWENYYEETNYSDPGMQQKLEVIEKILAGFEVAPETVLDLGANNGRFSLLATRYAKTVIAQDIDHNAISQLYFNLRAENNNDGVLPLVQDLSNPSPTLGWAQAEREGLMQRGRVDVVMALALVHHLAIGNNLPLKSIVGFLAALGKHVIIEFVPKGDSQVDRMLVTREDIFCDYTQENFELALAPTFKILNKYPLADSQRIVYSLIGNEYA